MKVYYFKEWRAALVGSELAPQVRQSFEITIHWYLSYLKRARMLASILGARVGVFQDALEVSPSLCLIREDRYLGYGIWGYLGA